MRAHAPLRGTSGSTSSRPVADSTRAASSSVATPSPTGCACGGGCPSCSSASHDGAPGQAPVDDVRIHTGAESQRAAAALNANAFTIGRDIHFGSGQYRPGTKAGDRLIAHEVSHALQPEAAPDSSHDSVSRPDDPAELEADLAADAWLSGQSFAPSERRTAAIHRDDKADAPKKKIFVKEGFTGRETEEQARLIAASKGWVVEGRMHWSGRNWIGENVRAGTGKERALAQVRLDLQQVAESTVNVGVGDFDNAFPDAGDLYLPGEEHSDRPPRFGEGDSETGENETKTEGTATEGDTKKDEKGSQEKAEGTSGSSTGTGANEIDPLTAVASMMLDPTSLSELKKNTTGESGSPAGGIGWITGGLAKFLTVVAAALSVFTGPIVKLVGKVAGLARKGLGGFMSRMRSLLRMTPKTVPPVRPPMPRGAPVVAETPEPSPSAVPEEVPAGSATDTTARLANPAERLGDQYGNFLIKGKKPVLNGRTYEWEIYGLEQIKPYPPGSSIAAPLKAVQEAADLMIAEARAAGATQMKIWGKAIGNRSVYDFTQYVERRLGGIAVDVDARTRYFLIPVR